jgi:rhodanese-related sulfurtransferase
MRVQELAAILEAGAEGAQCVDVRELWEFETARLPHFRLFPLGSLSQWRVLCALARRNALTR